MRRSHLMSGMLWGLLALMAGGFVLLAQPAGAELPASAEARVQPDANTNTPTRTFTRTPTITLTPTTCPYVVNQAAATPFPGVTDIGNNCDDCVTAITLPFAYRLYDLTFITATVSSNGNLQFASNSPRSSHTCPNELPSVGFSYTIFAHWQDLDTSCVGCGVFTAVSGTSPNRIFAIQWLASYFKGQPGLDFEILLYEGQTRFDVIYNAVPEGGVSTLVGVQKTQSSGQFTQYICNAPGSLAGGLRLVFTVPGCAGGTATPTNTPLATNTPTDTPTDTPTFTPAITDTPTDTPSNTPSNTATNTATRTPTNTPIPAGVLVAHVVWQARGTQPSSLQQMPITLTLKSGATEVNYPIQVTDPSGFFTTTVSTLPPGTYNWRVKGPSYLSTAGVVTMPGGTTNLEMGLQKAADINGDDVVNSTDFTTLKNNFGQGGAPPIRYR
jgi:hypothetical protein